MSTTARQLSLRDCYAVLDIRQGASLEEVKRAYRRRAFELHPDLNPGKPDAHRQFQLLNEAYVALSAVLKAETAQRRTAGGEAGRQETGESSRRKTDRQTAYARSKQAGSAAGKTEQKKSSQSGGTEQTASSRAQTEQETSARSATGQSGSNTQTGQKTSAQGGTGQSGTSRSPNGQAGPSSAPGGAGGPDRQTRERTAAYTQESVLRDLLNDPFARHVFADIYSELHKKEAEAAEKPEPEVRTAREREPLPKKPWKAPFHPGSRLPFLKGTTTYVKNWLRKQIDEEQTMYFPAQQLKPGAKLRLQIRRGLSEQLETVDVVLPVNFCPGKPIRLKGMGKRIASWQGDLYLTLEYKE